MVLELSFVLDSDTLLLVTVYVRVSKLSRYHSNYMNWYGNYLLLDVYCDCASEVANTSVICAGEY